MTKRYWMINGKGHVCTAPDEGKYANARKKYGNHFETKGDALRAREAIAELFKNIKS